MANGDGQNRNVVPQGQRAPSVVQLGLPASIDLGFLSDAAREQLMKDYARGVLDVAPKSSGAWR
jgi:hypothetical protein